MKEMFQKMHTVDMETLIAGVSLYRPGPLEYIPSYISRANGESEVSYLTPELEEILKPTHGIIVYQEQIMQIARKLGGYGQGESDSFRRAVGKKKQSVMRPALEQLESRIVDQGYTETLATQIVELIEPFVGNPLPSAREGRYHLA